ncbi:MAG: hypothetical protein ACPGN3_11840 [Opitutales bacterium]
MLKFTEELVSLSDQSGLVEDQIAQIEEYSKASTDADHFGELSRLLQEKGLVDSAVYALRKQYSLTAKHDLLGIIEMLTWHKQCLAFQGLYSEERGRFQNTSSVEGPVVSAMIDGPPWGFVGLNLPIVTLKRFIEELGYRFCIYNLNTLSEREADLISNESDYIIVNGSSLVGVNSPATKILSSHPEKSLFYVHESSHQVEKMVGSKRSRVFQAIFSKVPVAFVSEKQKDIWESQYSIRRAHVIGNCNPNNVFFPQWRRKCPEKRVSRVRKIISIGSIQERKGVPEFIRLVRAVKESGVSLDWEWVGQLNNSRRNQIRAWGGDNEILRYFSGPSFGKELFEKIHSADLCIVFSNDDAGPMTVADSLDAGTPVLCSSGIGASQITRETPACELFDDYCGLERKVLGLEQYSVPVISRDWSCQFSAPSLVAERVLRIFCL